jgi:hypothetical protein
MRGIILEGKPDKRKKKFLTELKGKLVKIPMLGEECKEERGGRREIFSFLFFSGISMGYN